MVLRERKEEREININVSEKHQLIASQDHPTPRYVP